MNISSRFVGLVAAVILTGLQWAPFFGTALQVAAHAVTSSVQT
jgi:hypothetical protein